MAQIDPGEFPAENTDPWFTPLRNLIVKIIGQGNTAVQFSIQSEAGYPARGNDQVVVFIGATNPEALMGPEDFWVNSALGPALTLDAIATALLVPGSAVSEAVAVAVGQQEQIWLAGASMGVGSGSPTTGFVGTSATSRVRAMMLDPDTSETIVQTLIVPEGWTSVRFSLFWTIEAAQVGNVRWSLGGQMMTDGVQIGDAYVGLGDQTIAVPEQRVLKVTVFPDTLAATASGAMRLALTRQAANASDTATGDAAVVGILMERAG